MVFAVRDGLASLATGEVGWRPRASACYFKQMEDQEDAIDEELVRRCKIAAKRELEFQILAFQTLEFCRLIEPNFP